MGTYYGKIPYCQLTSECTESETYKAENKKSDKSDYEFCRSFVNQSAPIIDENSQKQKGPLAGALRFILLALSRLRPTTDRPDAAASLSGRLAGS